MKKNYLTTCMLISLFSLSACAQTQNWNGIYSYDASLGENVAEDKILIEYVFTLDKNKCVISSQGYQTYEKILCAAAESEGNLVVTFSSYEDGSTKNAYDVEIYPPKSTLFTLTQKDSKLITTWGSLAPDESHTTGEHFKKAAK
jgi:hypothetical protein